MSRDRGVVALIVVLMFSTGIFIGCAALTVDLGQVMAERRVLQNGADAAVLSLARTCAADPDCSWTTASAAGLGGASIVSLNNVNAGKDQLAGFDNTNSFNGATYPHGICGAGYPNLPTCSPAVSYDDLRNCPPTTATKYVEVHTITASTTAVASKVAPVFGQALIPGYTGESVHACARAAVGGVTGGIAFPMTISLCEWDRLVGGGDPDRIVPPAPYPPYPSDPSTFGTLTTYENVVYMHDATEALDCSSAPSGGLLPGGFGWLEPTSGCELVVNNGDWVDEKTGNSAPGSCTMSSYVGTTVFLPIFDDTSGLSRGTGQYRVKYLVAFYLTGYSVPSDRPASVATGRQYCLPSQTCIYGWFTSGLQSVGSTTGSGTPSPTVTSIAVAG
jgi:hypothetical protein